ncbi:MAG TPA: universal stress protein, partial [Micromonosporaceae bacterium]|nr:universal stress protein [Micromonosporaceae bacterium]
MMTRLVVGYDGSAGARAGVRWALDEAARAGGRVELMFAAEWPAYPPAAPMVPGIVVWPDAQTQRRTHDMLAAARVAAAASHPGVPVTTSLVRLPAPVALVERSRDATLVVLGSHGHGGFSGALLGSVSLTVTAHAHCPVVVVRGAEGGSGDARPVVAG